MQTQAITFYILHILVTVRLGVILVTVRLGVILINNQLDAQFYYVYTFISIVYLFRAGSQDGVNGIGTRYGLEVPGIESRWGEIFRTYPERLRCPPSLLYNGYRVFSGGKLRPGRHADPSPLLVQKSNRIELYLYSP